MSPSSSKEHQAHNFNQELLVGINKLKQERNAITKEIESEEEVAKRLNEEIASLQERLSNANSNLEALRESKEAYNNTIEQTELACKYQMFLEWCPMTFG
jgi:uncharacterized coiled-coil DUF342 family protein